jgi:hypothetical protein
MVALTCPACAAEVKPDDLICFTCGANLPRRQPDDDPPPPATIPTGNVEVPAGTSLLLGRDPAESLVAAAFSQFDNVSRRHATVTVDDAGYATIRDEHSTNGTFVNGDRVLPGNTVRLADGDVVRLGADIAGDVLLPRQEPDPASLSRDHGEPE